MRYDSHETADAIETLDELQDILRDLSIYREHRAVIIGLKYEVELMQCRLSCQYGPATSRQLTWIKKLSRRVHQVDAVLRPLG